MITTNLCSSVVNGSRGIVQDLVFEEGAKLPALPLIVWTEIDTYTGPSFFPNGSGRDKWFPIRPITHTWWSNKKKGTDVEVETMDGNDWEENSRTMLPMKLCWALTIWKAQGQTMRSKIVLHLGSKEKDHGLTYTAFSRATRFSNVGIYDGFATIRITDKIKQQGKMEGRIREEKRYQKIIEKTRNQYGNSGNA